MTEAELRALAAELLRHVGIEPSSPAEMNQAGELRARLERLVDAQQPAPRPTSGRPIWSLVIDDMCARDQEGRRRYGTPLQAGNGRDALRDAYEEALDLAVYLRQAIEEGR